MRNPADFHIEHSFSDAASDGRWVTDDFDEEEALQKCQENGFTPYGAAHDDEIAANAMSNLQPIGRPSTAYLTGYDPSIARQNVLAPLYTVGGTTTQFGSSGVDPWSDAGWGGKRTKLRAIGVGDEDWMFRTAEEGRMVNEQLRQARGERLQVLEGVDAIRGWVYALQRTRDGIKPDVRRGASMRPPDRANQNGRDKSPDLLKPPAPEPRRSTLNQEITMEDEVLTPLTGSVSDDNIVGANANGDGPSDIREAQDAGSLALEGGPNGVERTPGGKIVVQTLEEARAHAAKYNWGLGQWQPGVIRAIYEVSHPMLNCLKSPIFTS